MDRFRAAAVPASTVETGASIQERFSSRKESIMNLLWAIIVGLIAGVLAKLLMPGRDPGGMLVTIGIGIAGSVIANLLGRAMGWYTEGQSAGIIGSTVGAILLLIVYRMIKGGRGGHIDTPLRP